jgi:hypothetical protein
MVRNLPVNLFLFLLAATVSVAAEIKVASPTSHVRLAVVLEVLTTRPEVSLVTVCVSSFQSGLVLVVDLKFVSLAAS